MLNHLFQNSNDDNPRLAVTVMLCGLLCLSLQDALIKMASDKTTLWQLQSFRALVNIFFVWTILKRLMPASTLRPKRVGIVVMRSVFQVGALTLFFGGAPFLSLAQMAGGLYTFPLFVGLFGMLLGESVGPRRIFAIIAGFAGTLLVLRPDAQDYSLMALMPVGAGFCYAMFVVTTRRFCRDESPLALVLFANITIATVGLAGMYLVPWLPVSDAQRLQYPFLLTVNEPLVLIVVLVILSCSLLNTIGNLCLSKAYQSADSSFLAPFDYSYLLFATAWGVILFADIPQFSTVMGLLLIAGAGLFVAWREHLAEKSKIHGGD